MKTMLRILTGFLGLLLAFTSGLAENVDMSDLVVPGVAFIPEVQSSPEDGDKPFSNLSPQLPSAYKVAQASGPAQPRRIRVVFPNGGEQWEKGKTYTIRWISTGNIPEVRILFRWTIGQGAWIPIVDRAPNTGEFSFKVPEDLKHEGSGFLVVVMTPDGLVSDASDVSFTVVAAARPEPKAELKPVPTVSPPAPILPKITKGKTLVAVETAKGKTVKIRKYEVQEAKGYTEQELKQVQAELTKEKMAVGKARMEKRIEDLARKSPLAGILIPLLYQQMEEQSQNPLMATSAPQRPGVRTPVQIDISPQLQTRVQAFKQVSPSVKNQYFHPRYANLQPGQKLEKLQLGRDILQVLRPNYEMEIRQIVKKSFAPNRPKFQWEASKIKKAALGTKSRPAAVSPHAFSFKKGDFDALVNRMGGSLSSNAPTLLQQWAHAQGLQAAKSGPTRIHEYLMQKAGLSPQGVPDLNKDHATRNYYESHVTLDSFVVNNLNEYADEPYWQITTSVPQYDPNDPELMYLLTDGNMYKIGGQITASYDAHRRDRTYVFRLRDRDLIYANTYNTNASISFTSWEEDWSKDYVESGAKDALNDIANLVMREVQEAVLQAVKYSLLTALQQEFPLVKPLLDELLQASKISPGDLLNLIQAVSAAYLQIDLSWVLLVLLYGGGIEDVWAMLEASFTACPEVTIALIALQVAGPIVLDLFQGNFEEAFKELLLLPIAIVEFIIDIFREPIQLIQAILAACDSDDLIQAQTINLKGSLEDIFQDFQDRDGKPWPWGQYAGVPLQEAESFYRRHGYGPTEQNNSMRKNNILWQPLVTFKNSDTEYAVYLNVKRTLAGGRETFGYSVKATSQCQQKPELCLQTRRYEAKSAREGQIRVMVSALNSTDRVPVVNIWNKKRGISANNYGIPNPREFFITSYPGEEYVLQIYTADFLGGDFYGYVTLEEKESREPAFILLSQSRDDKEWVVGQKNYLAELIPLSSLPASRDKYFKMGPGLADPGAISFESLAYPGYFLRHQNFRLKLHSKTQDRLFQEDATFWRKELLKCEVSSPAVGGGDPHHQQQQKLTDDAQSPHGQDPGVDPRSQHQPDRTGVAFESFNYPGFFIYAKGRELIIQEEKGRCKPRDFRKKVYFNPKLEFFEKASSGGTSSGGGSPSGGAGPSAGGGAEADDRSKHAK